MHEICNYISTYKLKFHPSPEKEGRMNKVNMILHFHAGRKVLKTYQIRWKFGMIFLSLENPSPCQNRKPGLTRLKWEIGLIISFSSDFKLNSVHFTHVETMQPKFKFKRRKPVVHHWCQPKDYLLSYTVFWIGNFQHLLDWWQLEDYYEELTQVA